MIFQIFLLDVKGKVLVSRNYRGDIDSSVIDKFMNLLLEKGRFWLIFMTLGGVLGWFWRNFYDFDVLWVFCEIQFVILYQLDFFHH